jgi:hypothetical protein
MLKITPKIHNEEKAWFDFICNKQFPGYTSQYNEEQRVGCGKDAAFVGPMGDVVTVELKDDLISEKYGNLFVEISQTFDGKNNWLESGLVLAAKQSDIYIHIGYGDDSTYIFFFEPEKLLETLRHSRFGIKETAPYKNGNRRGAYAKGFIVPFHAKSRDYDAAYGMQWPSFDALYQSTKYEIAQLELISHF